jgi:hypothetical protein
VKKLSNFVVRDTQKFNKAVKKLKKRFKNIEKDTSTFVDCLENYEDLGTYLGDGIYKARVANSDKNSGKSGGYRLISYLKLIENEVYLLYIYDKSDFENITENEIDTLILGLTQSP